jgi:hypothetical protein
MARRRPLTDEQWAALLAPPTTEQDIVRHYTLTSYDFVTIIGKSTTHNRLNYTLLLRAHRHSGRALEPREMPQASMAIYVARQLSVDPMNSVRMGVLRRNQRGPPSAEMMPSHAEVMEPSLHVGGGVCNPLDKHSECAGTVPSAENQTAMSSSRPQYRTLIVKVRKK